MSSVIDMRARTSRTLDASVQSEETAQEPDVADVPRLARLLTRMLRDIAALKRRFSPRVITYVNLDVDATGTTVYQLVHKFGGPVAWWPVGWSSGSSDCPKLRESGTPDRDTLSLISHVAGTVAIRVEELG